MAAQAGCQPQRDMRPERGAQGRHPAFLTVPLGPPSLQRRRARQSSLGGSHHMHSVQQPVKILRDYELSVPRPQEASSLHSAQQALGGYAQLI